MTLHADDPHFVYRCYGVGDELLYIGCTVNPPLRMKQHARNTDWFPEVVRVRLLVFPSRRAGYAAESRAIRAELPRYNRPKGSPIFAAKTEASLRLLKGGAA